MYTRVISYITDPQPRKSEAAGSPKIPRKSAKAIAVAAFSVAAWLSLSAAGMRIVLEHEFGQGLRASAPRSWPAESAIERARDRATLVMLAHPHCPCTRASIGELSAIMARGQGLIAAYVLFIRPEGVPDDWTRTDTWRKASSIPGVRVIADDHDVEARLFGALTSGQVLLYDRDGLLAFSGGITQSRAHYGDNEGVEAILSIVTSGAAARHETAVFGCPLFGPRLARVDRIEPCNK